jgi:hypothetical protein
LQGKILKQYYEGISKIVFENSTFLRVLLASDDIVYISDVTYVICNSEVLLKPLQFYNKAVGSLVKCIDNNYTQ